MTGEPIDPGVIELAGQAGADPDADGPSARATAAFFDLPAMAELLDAR